ncbi:lipase family protein [Tautonia plasticadhaerens]|uniref:Lipase (Class 3) n=1 Tax=Tautonia plasticadhaerens TaxID=2527974 RepID=A0A518HCC9_9BACT|nr:lipase family protein [Tautonia plasticadhaerens]QDV38514.1 Lipase (class 3) [Tautonia plasticadhaerens]
MAHDQRTEAAAPDGEAQGPADGQPSVEQAATVLDAALAVNAEAHRLILTFALAGALVTALPSASWMYELKLVVVLLLNGFMIREVGRRWGNSRGQGPLTIAIAALGLIGAVAVAVMAFMVVFSISLYVPVVRSWAEAAAYFALTLAVGRVANEYFQGARTVDRDRLARLIARRRARRGAEQQREAARWTRRRVLLGGVGLGLVAGSVADFFRWRRSVARGRAPVEGAVGDPFAAAYATEAAWQAEVRSILDLGERVAIPPPRVPYDRDEARRMIFACKMAVMQYRIGRAAPDYSGNVTRVREFAQVFGDDPMMARFFAEAIQFRDRFGTSDQVATLVAEQEFYEQYLDVEHPPLWEGAESPMQRLVRPVETALYETVPRYVRHEYRLPVFVGFVLKTERANVVVFRGTQTSAEWLHNLSSTQRPYTDPESGRFCGWIHGGFLAMAAQIRPRPVEVAALLDPSKPCYIAGHSLGSAVATIWALRLALLRPELSEQIRLYSFAGPRVGDPAFVKAFGELVPNAYRVVNLADSITLVPASTMGKTFAHVGQQVSFVGAAGELLLNHVVDLYQLALDRGVETTEELPPVRT